MIAEDYVLKPPPKVIEASEAYRDENDWLNHFLDDQCDINPSYTEKSGELYAAYRAYALSVGEYTRSARDFTSALEQLGFSRHRLKAGVTVYGLRLKSEFDL